MLHLFAATGLLIALLAAGMAAQSMALLESAGVVQVFGETLWNSSGILSETGLSGRVLHAMVGYMDRPTPAEGLAYALVLVAILGLGRLLRAPRRAAPARAA
jgi:high-affinity iron transporter